MQLSPATRSGVYGVAATTDWSEAGIAGRTTLLFSPVTIDQPWGAARWNRVGTRFAALLKDLTLPIVIVVLGGWLARKQKEAEDRRKGEQDDREKARITAEKEIEEQRIATEKLREEAHRVARLEQTEAQEVRRLLLNRVMEMAQQHYLPFVSHSKQILIEAEKIENQKPDAAPEQLFFQVLILLKRMDTFRLAQGGMFFQTRDGERAAGAAWYLMKSNIYAALGVENVATALSVVRIDWDYAIFRARFKELAALWGAFQLWLKEPLTSKALLGSFWQILEVVDAFQAVMSFEADKALSTHWYGEPGRLEFMRDEPTILYRRELMDPFAKGKIEQLEGCWVASLRKLQSHA